MTNLARDLGEVSAGVIYSDSLSAFDELVSGADQLAVVSRTLPADFSAALEAKLDSAQLCFEEGALRHPRSLQPRLEALQSIGLGPLANDLEELVSRFFSLSGGASIKVSLGVVDTDRCRKFHTDYVRLRLITTYSGPGTEWILPSDVRYEVLESPLVCSDAHNHAILRPSAAVMRARPGDVLLMKGRNFNSQNPGLVHRSPPILDQGLRRLVLVLTQ